jgi:hypothetical protein
MGNKPTKPIKKKNILKVTPKEERKAIPAGVSNKVKARHFFECAWCSTPLNDRHHIEHYAKGGEDTEENLILLCPNCHREVHSEFSNILNEDLYNRKSTHLRGDRFSGSVLFNLNENKIRVGNSIVEDFNHILKLGTENVISIDKIGNEYYLNCRFYSKAGALIFWMSKNRFWTIRDFHCYNRGNAIEIRSNTSEKNFLKLWVKDDLLTLECSNYFQGGVFTASSGGTEIRNGNKVLKILGEGTIKFAGSSSDSSLFNM